MVYRIFWFTFRVTKSKMGLNRVVYLPEIAIFKEFRKDDILRGFEILLLSPEFETEPLATSYYSIINWLAFQLKFRRNSFL